MTIRDIAIAFGYEVDKSSESKAESSITGLKNMAKKALGAIGIAVSIAGVARAITQCISLSSEVEEMENKFNVVFSGMEDTVDQWASNYADAIGRNKNDIKSYLADAQNLLVGMGMERSAAADLDKQMVTLAIDLASFNNIDEATAVNAMTKALMGETESAKTLGAVLNDNTREQAMLTLGLTGTYQALDEATKMQVNYQAILNQSSDAIGDCERSMGSYQSTMRSFKSKLAELKTMVGDFFMPTAQKILALGSKGVMKLRDLMIKVQAFADKIGGTEKLLKLLTITAGAFLVVFNWSKILTGLKAVKTFITGISSGLSVAKLKLFAIVAVIVLVALLVEDFIAFMKGEDSLIGSILEKAGIDTEAFRQKVIDIWNTIKSTLSAVWNFLKGVATTIWNALKEFWDENGEEIKASLLQIWESIKTVLSALWNTIKTVATVVFNALKAFWDQWGDKIKTSFGTLWNGVKDIFMTVLNIITNIFTAFSALLSGDWSTLWESLKNIVTGIWDAIVTAVSTVLNVLWTLFGDILTNIWNKVVEVFTNIWTSIVDTVTGIKDSIVSGFQAAIDWITSLPAQALQWGKDIIQSIIDGIKSKIAAIGEAVSGVADKIKGFLGFSEPEEGPLSDFHTYMPDMMNLMQTGIDQNKGKVIKAVQTLTGDMSLIVKGAQPQPKTANTMVSSSTNKVITQNIEFNQQFNGDQAGQKKSAAAMETAAADTTGALARALAYAK